MMTFAAWYGCAPPPKGGRDKACETRGSASRPQAVAKPLVAVTVFKRRRRACKGCQSLVPESSAVGTRTSPADHSGDGEHTEGSEQRHRKETGDKLI